MRQEALADYLELWGVDRDFAVFSDGSVGFGFDLVPINGECLADGAINETSEKAMRFLGSLAEGLDVQFVQDIAAGAGAVADAHRALQQPQSPPISRELTEARIKRFRDLDKGGQLPAHRLSLYVRRPFRSAISTPRRLLKGSQDFAAMTENAYAEAMVGADRLQEEMETELQAFGLAPRRILADELLEAIYRQWNPTRAASLGRVDPENIRPSLLFSDASVEDSGFALGGMHHKVVTLKLLPDQTTAGMAAALRSLPFDSRVFLSIHVPDQQKEMESLQTQRRVAYSMAVGKKSGAADIASHARLGGLESLLEQMIADCERVFHTSLAILLRSESEDDLRLKVAETLAALRGLGGAEGIEEGLAAFPIFAGLALPNARARERVKRLKTSNLADLLPIYGPWRGHQVPHVLLRTRLGSPLSLDPFDPTLTNANQLISGASGSGKSFLTNIVLLHMLKEKPKVYFVDIGGSYKKLAENLGGQYIDLSLNGDLTLNPFDLKDGEREPPPEKIKFLLGLVELMTKEEGAERLPRLERAEIEQAIAQLYRQMPCPRLSHLKDILLAHRDQLVQRYGRILATWCGETPFGRLLDRETTVRLGADVVAFDLKGMESYPDLQAVCLYIITDLVWREVQRDRKTMKFLVFDECWKLLKSESGLAFIEEVFRTFRKYFASAIAISQDIDDFARSKIASAILPNCSIKWILMQPQIDKTRLKEVLALNDNETELVSSLSQKKGVYSEAFLIAGSERTVAVVESTPLELWIATTDPRDLAMLDARKKETPDADVSIILSRLADEYPRGVAAAR